METHSGDTLLVTGGQNPGHPHREEDARALVSLWRCSVQVSALQNLTAAELEAHERVVVLTSLESASAAQLAALVDVASCPGARLLLFHEAAIFDRGASRMKLLLGGRFARHEPYAPFAATAVPHPLSRGLPEAVTVSDELYAFDEPFVLPADARVWLRARGEEPLAWERRWPNGARLCYVSLGHDWNSSLRLDWFRRLLLNLYAWLYGGCGK